MADRAENVLVLGMALAFLAVLAQSPYLLLAAAPLLATGAYLTWR